jgi:hypothetical protein
MSSLAHIDLSLYNAVGQVQGFSGANFGSNLTRLSLRDYSIVQHQISMWNPSVVLLPIIKSTQGGDKPEQV